ncbi:hypothetical protein [Undibacterium danionis]|uniref:DUF2486 family protein n=1 Tax=Undibacterium danionis TaxID=1812100 RepID=A0ABV6I8W6_9BURK
MNDQIDSSIPVLTEVIAPTTPATTERQTTAQPTSSAPNKPATSVRPTPDIKSPTAPASPVANINTATATAAMSKPISPTNSISVPKAAPAPISAPATQGKFFEEVKQEQVAVQNCDNMSTEAWLQMEHKLKENVLRQVLARVDFVLEHRVRDSLAEVLQSAVDQLADDIRAGLRQSLEEVITRAVTQELSKLKSHKP